MRLRLARKIQKAIGTPRESAYSRRQITRAIRRVERMRTARESLDAAWLSSDFQAWDDDDFDYRDDAYGEEWCPVCGSSMEYESCWSCYGEGGFHDCGDDCCCCLYPEDDLNEECDICHGRGGYMVCINAGKHQAIEAKNSTI